MNSPSTASPRSRHLFFRVLRRPRMVMTCGCDTRPWMPAPTRRKPSGTTRWCGPHALPPRWKLSTRSCVVDLRASLGAEPRSIDSASGADAVLFGTPASSPEIAALKLPLEPLGSEGFLIRQIVGGGRTRTVIAANSDAGVLYGAFEFLRAGRPRPVPRSEVSSRPSTKIRAAESLGQPRSARRARLCGSIDLELAQAAGLSRSALHRLRARLRLHRHQRHGAHQRERQRHRASRRRISRRRRRWRASCGPTAFACTSPRASARPSSSVA